MILGCTLKNPKAWETEVESTSFSLWEELSLLVSGWTLQQGNLVLGLETFAEVDALISFSELNLRPAKVLFVLPVH